MTWNASVFQCWGAGYTDGTTSVYFKGHTTVPTIGMVNNNGSIGLGEGLIGNDYAPEENASLMYVEFNITTMPTASTPLYNGAFNISATINGNMMNSSNVYGATCALTYATIVPEFPVSLIPTIIVLETLMAIGINKRRKVKYRQK
jgi:hypothetical protein